MRRRKIKRNYRHGGEMRGNNTDRRNRKLWILKTFGDGKKVPCVHCGKKLTYDTLTVDRIIPACRGGRYVHGNIQPSCKFCNDQRGGRECHYSPSKEEAAMEKAFSISRNPRRRKLKIVKKWRTKAYKRHRRAA